VLVNEKTAKEAWLLLVSYARVTDEAWDLIGTRPVTSLTDLDLKAAHRIAVRLTHPDRTRTDSTAEFVAVDRAKCLLEAWLAKPKVTTDQHKKKPCDYCDGKGHVFTSSSRPGSHGLRRTCPKCHGSGDADFDARR
jgi:DnaJ-class molecular chaperone